MNFVMKYCTRYYFYYFIIIVFAVFTISTILFILGNIFVKGLPYLSWDFITTISESVESGGILAPILGTIYIIVLTALFSFPLGLFTAIYLSEYIAHKKMFYFLDLVIINLAGIPSIVYGLFGLGFFVLLLNISASILAASLTMACLVLPIIITISYQAFQDVPTELREASTALGATRLQTIFRCVIPIALSKVLTGLILAMSRAAGETAPLLFTGAVYYVSHLPSSVYDRTMALSYHLFVVSTQVAGASEELKYAITTTLLLVVFIFNGLAAWMRYSLSNGNK